MNTFICKLNENYLYKDLETKIIKIFRVDIDLIGVVNFFETISYLKKKLIISYRVRVRAIISQVVYLPPALTGYYFASVPHGQVAIPTGIGVAGKKNNPK